MLVELRVRDLGVIADLTLELGPGMTALTGETGAGKTLVVEAIELLVGGKADPVLVRPGAAEAIVEGRFVDGDVETVVMRTVPAAGGGRSRASIDGTMATLSALAERGAALVDLHGQHAHQSLLSPAIQRAALDAFGAIDSEPLVAARRQLREIDAALADLGGDARARAGELDLLRFQYAELEAAAVDDPDEDAILEREEEVLADADAARAAAAAAHDALIEDAGAADSVGAALGAIAGRPALVGFEERLRGLQAELADAALELRSLGEQLEADPERLERVRARRRQLHDLRRKYGETLADVIAFAAEAQRRYDELTSHDERVAELEAGRANAEAALGRAAARRVAEARRKAAPRLAEAVQANLRELALPRARIEVAVAGDDPADDVAFLFAANQGEPPLPLTKVASGGELARTMLAARLVLTDAPPTLVFDEVDAGIGGTATVAVGRSLAALAADHQVLVVTHLPQVAAFADAQIVVEKDEVDGRTLASAQPLDDGGRVVELSRMLSGQPESATARDHAEELLASAARERGR